MEIQSLFDYKIAAFWNALIFSKLEYVCVLCYKSYLNILEVDNFDYFGLIKSSCSYRIEIKFKVNKYIYFMIIRSL